jgi:hypothetical protein
MNPIGRTLVILNLVGSIFVGGIVIALYKKNDWPRAYDRVSAQLAGEHQEYTTFIDQHNKMVGKYNDDLDEAKKDTARLTADLKAADARVKDAQAEVKVARDKAAADDAERKKLIAERDNVVVENQQKDKLLAAQLTTITTLETQFKDAKAQEVKYKIASESTGARNSQLVDQIEKMQRELSDLRNDRAVKLGSAGLQQNPPPEDVKGTIKSTDPASGLVTINLGSDSGLTKGNTLHVYRTSPRPSYIGLLRVVDVRPNEAVGKLTTSARAGAIQVGDEVASKILDNR